MIAANAGTPFGLRHGYEGKVHPVHNDLMRVALLCEEAAGRRALELVLRSRHELAAVVTSPASPAWALAQKLGHSPIPAAGVREARFVDDLARLRVDLLLNVHSLYIVPEPVLRLPRHGAYNLHPGPLPDYAGLNAPSWALYHGADMHGVTLHRMEPGIDTGPIVFQQRFPVGPRDTGLTLSLRCADEGLRLVERLLEADPASLALSPQDLARRRYFGRGAPQGGRIDWRSAARLIERFVRACDYQPFGSPWGAPVAELEGRSVQILKVALTGEACREAPGSVRSHGAQRTWVATADEWLELRRTAPAGGAALSTAERPSFAI
jgi:UDP-4-amino-4-deoxy-L-arabinose formyltransferase/UDP-glucuronic acid dehydrogenase (UDP-4-keto-hexauronic acid decarboxylating)